MATRVAGGVGRDAVMWCYRTFSGGTWARSAVETLLAKVAPQPATPVVKAISRLAYVIDKTTW